MSKMLEKKRERGKNLKIKSILRIQMSNIQNITKQIKFEKTTTTTTKYSLVMLTCLHQIEMLFDNPIFSIYTIKESDDKKKINIQ